MYPRPKYKQTRFSVNKSTEGETIEMKMERVLNNKEPIKDGAPIIYTERKEGVKPQHDIRTDRWELAVDASDKIARSYKARREDRIQKGSITKEEDGKPEPIQGKSETDTKTK